MKKTIGIFMAFLVVNILLFISIYYNIKLWQIVCLAFLSGVLFWNLVLQIIGRLLLKKHLERIEKIEHDKLFL